MVRPDDQDAVLANFGDIKSCGVRGHVFEWRAWPIRAIIAPGIRGGLGKTAHSGGFPARLNCG